jgi:hypothetical protein
MSDRAIGGIGLAAVALIAVAALVEPLWDWPPTEASGAEVAAYIGRNRHGTIASILLYTAGMGLLLLFALGLWGRFARDERVPARLATAFGAGSVSLVTLVYAGFAPTLVLAYRAPEVGAARELRDLSFGVLALSGVPTAIALGAFAAIVVPGRSLPRVTGWAAVLGAIAHVAILASFLPRTGFFSLEGGVIVAIPATMFLWMLVTSVALVGAR